MPLYIGSPMVWGWIKIISNPKPWQILFITCYNTQLFSFHYFSVTFKQKCLTSFQQYCIIVHSDVIAVVQEKFIPWVISTAYWCKNEIKVYIHLINKGNTYHWTSIHDWLLHCTCLLLGQNRCFLPSAHSVKSATTVHQEVVVCFLSLFFI